MSIPRTLYDCAHAIVHGERICCRKGHAFLSINSPDGRINITKLRRGDPLALNVCQPCSDFDIMGPPIPKDERGWLKQEEEK